MTVNQRKQSLAISCIDEVVPPYFARLIPLSFPVNEVGKE